MVTPQVCPLDGEKKPTGSDPPACSSASVSVKVCRSGSDWIRSDKASLSSVYLTSVLELHQHTKNTSLFFPPFLYLNDSWKPRVVFTSTWTFACVRVSFLTLRVEPQQRRRSKRHWRNGEKVFFGRCNRHKMSKSRRRRWRGVSRPKRTDQHVFC